MILYISDFDLSGSGYMRIGTRLCNELMLNHDIGVIALGLGYKGEEHNWPFSIVPCRHLSHIPIMVNQIRNYGAPIEALVVAMDIPVQENLMKAMNIPGDIPYIGIFPLEAGPLCMPWAVQLLRMDARLVMSRFGWKELKKMGVDSEFIPFGVDNLDLWRPPTPEERMQIRQGLNIDEDTFVVLTVADNQERKNLSRAMEIFADFSIDIQECNQAGYAIRVESKRKTLWQLVTRVESPVGWKLEDLAMRLGVLDRIAFYNRGVPAQSLWSLYAAADCFLLTSKAEGLAIPVMEAMACRLPVVGTDCAAIHEHLYDRRGLLIESEYEYVDTFGNGTRCLASRVKGVDLLILLEENRDSISDHVLRAEAYVRERNWKKSGIILADAIQRVGKKLSNGQESTTQATISEAIGAAA